MKHALLVAALLAGCSKPDPNVADLDSCRAAILDSLVDPQSAQFEAGYSRLQHATSRSYTFRVNSKNRMGGYVGKREVACVLRTAPGEPAEVIWM